MTLDSSTVVSPVRTGFLIAAVAFFPQGDVQLPLQFLLPVPQSAIHQSTFPHIQASAFILQPSSFRLRIVPAWGRNRITLANLATLGRNPRSECSPKNGSELPRREYCHRKAERAPE